MARAPGVAWFPILNAALQIVIVVVLLSAERILKS